MKSLTGYIVGIPDEITSIQESNLPCDRQKITGLNTEEDPVLRTIPLFYEYINQKVINKAYRKAEQQQGQPIQRRSSAVLTPRILICIEIYKALHNNISYNQALGRVWNQLQDEGVVNRKRPSAGSYCDARKRLPEQVYEEIFKEIDKHVQQLITHQVTWNGLTIKTIDGVPLTLPNHPHLKEKFTVHNNQHGTAYWPKALGVWVADVGTGCLIAQQLGYKGEGESSLAPYMMENRVNKGDLLLGDADFGTTAVLSSIQQQGAFFLCRAHSSIDVEEYTIDRSSAGDRDLKIPITRYTKNKYDELDLEDVIEVRAIESQEDWFLTDLPRETHSKEQITDQLIEIRWSHETMNREIKTDQNLEGIRSQLETTVKQEMYANLIVYNVVRLLMCRALQSDDFHANEEKKRRPEQSREDKQQQVHQKRGIGIFEEKTQEDQNQIRVNIREYSYLGCLREIRYTNGKIAEHPRKSRRYIKHMRIRILRTTIYKRDSRKEPRMKRPDKSNYSEFLVSRKEWRQRYGYDDT